MNRLILIAAVFVLVGGPLGAVDDKGHMKPFVVVGCSKVLSAHALINQSGGKVYAQPEGQHLIG